MSDASGRPGLKRFSFGLKAAHHLVSVAMDQVRSLRARAVVAYLQAHGSPGRYLQIGNTSAQILKDAGGQPAGVAFLPDEEVRLAAEMETTIWQVTPSEFDRLYRHGFEVADANLYAYAPHQYALLAFHGSTT